MFNYITNLRKNQVYSYITSFFLFSFILSLFFPIRHVFLTQEAYLTGQYSDFTSFSLYLSDILLFTTCFLLLLPRGRIFFSKISLKTLSLSKFLLPNSYFLLLGFWLILGLIFHFSHNTLFWTLKWLELIVAYGTVATLAKSYQLSTINYRSFIKFFVSFSVIQSIIALLQFYKQTSLGLYRLGESHLAPNISGVAKLVVEGDLYIRGYGTFPHPNILAAFLVVSILVGVYLFLESSKKWQFIWGISIFLNILGLTATFSRGAFLALAVGLVIFFGFSLYPLLLRRGSRGEVAIPSLITVILIIIISAIFSLLLFRPYLLTRATISDKAVVERVQYNNIGLRMIKANPLFGMGAGESVLHMQQFSNAELKPWQKQPIHNYFLLSAAELGVPGALILILIFIFHFKSLVFNLKSEFSAYSLLLTATLCSFLVLMLFDHYFYTLQQTQLLLWIVLGLIASETKNPQEGG